MTDRQMESGGGKHFILVHGLAHGAWCWYKVVARLRAAGHRATALDMAASGVHPARLHEVASFEDYSRPLLDAVAAAPDGDRLVLVGHSLGGLSVALAMERFPGKVAAAVFLAASMPRVGSHMGVTIEEFKRAIKPDFFMDSTTTVLNTEQGPQTALLLGPNLLASKLYDQCPAEDLELGKLLIRPGFQFMDDPTMKDETLLTHANFGSVKRVFVIAKADTSNTEEMQRQTVDLSPGTDVEEIAGADHMAMLSKPTEVCEVLVRIADRCH
ncbi:probable esterase PIR7A [Sorghum bicolor]|uniref:probable esterase PIR7A n=1 Tax=Sorghum bicolor TaxID=4558 RepID=UPI000B4259EB|nr:probable esterase PIR7A [Sorghum bicolor]|eukprot:XP_002459051.2 probable esterase PIR7A [Sorghum bicolor]